MSTTSGDTMKRLLVFASGSKTGGGSGFENLVNAALCGTLKAQIVGVVSNHRDGGVERKAKILRVPFFHFSAPFEAGGYRRIVQDAQAEFVALSGWLKKVSGLNPQRTFNIHPGLLPEFGGNGMYGHHVHEAVMAAHGRGEIESSGISMHFVTEGEYDSGPVFFRIKVKIEPGDTPISLGERVNKMEHLWQPIITNRVLEGEIYWDGKNPDSLRGTILD